MLVVVVAAILLLWKYGTQSISNETNNQKTSSPLNISYNIENKNVTLVNGKSEVAIPGSAAKVKTFVFGSPIFGDLDGDGVQDAALFITQNTGGSGTFFYTAIALQKDGVYKSVGTVFLGDRIAPQSILIKEGIAMINYADRKKDEAMTVAPSVGVTKYLVVVDGGIKEFKLEDDGEQLFSGNLIMAEGARVFTPCGGTAHWVLGSSKAYSELTSAYTKNKSGTDPYSSVYAVVSGVVTPKPTDGFGKDYDYGIDIRNLFKVLPNGTCAAN